MGHSLGLSSKRLFTASVQAYTLQISTPLPMCLRPSSWCDSESVSGQRPCGHCRLSAYCWPSWNPLKAIADLQRRAPPAGCGQRFLTAHCEVTKAKLRCLYGSKYVSRYARVRLCRPFWRLAFPAASASRSLCRARSDVLHLCVEFGPQKNDDG